MAVWYRKALEAVPAYEAGRAPAAGSGGAPPLKLSSNESLWGPSPAVQERLRALAGEVYRYPDPAATGLRRALADAAGLDPAQVVVGNGADEILRLVTTVFLEAGTEAVLPAPSFAAYRLYAALAGAAVREVPLGPDGGMDLEAMAAAVSSRTRVVFLCNPNNPTGVVTPRAAWERFLDRLPQGVVVVSDEAYREFVTDPAYPDTLAAVREGRPVIHVRTFSKLYALAGLRVGWAALPAGLAELLWRARDPFANNSLGLAAAEAALADRAWTAHVQAETLAARRRLEEGLSRRGLRFTPSQTNFVLLDVRPESGSAFAARLETAGIAVRATESFGLPGHVRITVPPAAHLGRLLEALEAAQAEGPRS
ncbi:Histidinol-phosphate aminotransferase 2 [Candidatus Hydrogenisulfobacillus filiaventi]|uniref:Histidinol-phosphate aminotransferase n=1 Tax=Candidatus Hydrogenisulfobacillus filiaventi TaxID=2707344 RepID=A0A6F8ZEE0_9FIRM|nr:histidinol-phosphate transaminase [Bacillota bacterium]CAB1128238.1 Histidinol-phosphate aminotransferase 2 [Candidatus Hydrogenisulfobacillus filiaventi]